MTLCRTCNQPWDSHTSHFTICPACRTKMPVRRVNTKTDKRWKPAPFNHNYYARLGSKRSVYSIPLS